MRRKGGKRGDVRVGTSRRFAKRIFASAQGRRRHREKVCIRRRERVDERV